MFGNRTNNFGIFLLIIAILIIAGNYYHNKVLKYQKELKKTKTENATLQQIIDDQSQFIGDTLENLRIIDIQGKSLLLSSILKKESDLIVFKFSNSDCPDCVEKQWTSLTSLIHELAILGGFENGRQLINYTKRMEISIPIFRMTSRFCIKKYDQQRVPYIIIIDHNRIIKYIIPCNINEKLLNNILNNYIQLV